MKIRNFSIVIILTLLWSCEKKETGFTVSGKLDNAEGQMVYLHEMTSRDLIPVDSATIDTSGTFKLRGISAETRFFAIHSHTGSYAYLLAKTGDRIILSGDANDLSFPCHGVGLEKQFFEDQHREQVAMAQGQPTFFRNGELVNFFL